MAFKMVLPENGFANTLEVYSDEGILVEFHDNCIRWRRDVYHDFVCAAWQETNTYHDEEGDPSYQTERDLLVKEVHVDKNNISTILRSPSERRPGYNIICISGADGDFQFYFKDEEVTIYDDFYNRLVKWKWGLDPL